MSGMNCREFESWLIELGRNGPLGRDERARVVAHVDVCSACRAILHSQERLNAAACILATDAARLSMPPQVERMLLAEFASTRAFQRPQPRRYIYGVLGGAVAASLAVVWWLAYRPVPKDGVTASAHAAVTPAPALQSVQPTLAAIESPQRKRSKRTPQPAAEPEQPFIAIPYTLPLEPWERTDVVRMDMPVAALIAAGLPMSMMDPGASARTDVLVGQDGRARAIRLISVSISN
jgi:hypothetical protein